MPALLRDAGMAPTGRSILPKRQRTCHPARNDVTLLVNPLGERTTTVYDAAGRESQQKLANGTWTSHTYDAANNETLVTTRRSNNSVVSSFAYQYNAANQRTQVVNHDSDVTTYSYDSTRQLTGERYSGSPGPSRTTYVYDPAGNRMLLNVDGDRTTSTYDNANRLRRSVDTSGITTYTFDANGNQRRVESPTNDLTTYSWTYENQLKVAENPDGELTVPVYRPSFEL